MCGLTLLLAVAFIVNVASLDKRDVEHGPGGKPLLLDLHVPDSKEPFPAAILVQGGGFDEGSKSINAEPLFGPLSNAGFTRFSIDYRMAPDFRFPEATTDLKTDIEWLRANATTYRVDPARIALIGESAGGFLVNRAGTHETPRTKSAAVVDFYGPVDYGKLAAERRDHPGRFNMKSISRHAANGGGIRLFGAANPDAERLKKLHIISPIFAVHTGMPPCLCIHIGAACELVTIQIGSHGTSGWKAPAIQHWRPEMIAWLQKTHN